MSTVYVQKFHERVIFQHLRMNLQMQTARFPKAYSDQQAHNRSLECHVRLHASETQTDIDLLLRESSLVY